MEARESQVGGESSKVGVLFLRRLCHRRFYFWMVGRSECEWRRIGGFGRGRHVGRGEVEESFESLEEDFEIHTLFDAEPVESEENGSDVVTRPM